MHWTGTIKRIVQNPQKISVKFVKYFPKKYLILVLNYAIMYLTTKEQEANKMTYRQIKSYNLINDVNADKVNQLAESIRQNGFTGCPILVYGEQLLTGSHRLAALKALEEDGEDVDDMEAAEDVTDIIEGNIQRLEEEQGWTPDLDYGNIGWMLKGSWVEEYKNEITEW